MHVRKFLICACALLLLLSYLGCAGASGQYGVTSGNASWIGDTANGVPGIDEAGVSYITLHAGPTDGVKFVVWSDLPNKGSGDGGGKLGGASYRGSHRATDGREIHFQAESTDGVTGIAEIAGRSYDLSHGWLFLVSTQKDPATVMQVAPEAAPFPKSQKDLEELIGSTEPIRAFFEAQIESN